MSGVPYLKGDRESSAYRLGLLDSREHVYGRIERYKSPYVSGVCGGMI